MLAHQFGGINYIYHRSTSFPGAQPSCLFLTELKKKMALQVLAKQGHKSTQVEKLHLCTKFVSFCLFKPLLLTWQKDNPPEGCPWQACYPVSHVKFTSYLILIGSFSSSERNFPKENSFLFKESRSLEQLLQKVPI